jgi:hypothetical protein
VRRFHLSIAAIVLLGACSRSRTYHLPEADSDPEIAFGVLYDGSNQVAEIGDVVRRQNLTGYTIESKDGGLSPRLFIVSINGLESAANDACGTLSTRVDAIACRERVKSCGDDPVSCLVVLRAGESCDDRLPLPKGMPVKAFSPNDRGDFAPVSDPSSLLDGLQLCGPRTKLPCKNRLPGFVVTENGDFRCVAPSTQTECNLSIDLSDCGLGAAQGTVASDGAFSGSVGASGCMVSAAMSSELGANESGFTIACGPRRFVATYMEVLFGFAGCPRRGPGAFEEARAQTGVLIDPETNGSIRGVKVVQPNGWRARYLILGTGIDDCASAGCNYMGGSCDTQCNDSCMGTSAAFTDCLNTNGWAQCTGRTSMDDCIMRCDAFCLAGGSISDCQRHTHGHLLAVTSTLTPETDSLSSPSPKSRVPLPGGVALPVTGHQGLAILGPDPSAPWIVVAGESGISLFTTAPNETLTQAPPTLVLPPGFLAAGVAPVPNQPEQFVIFGNTSASPSKGALILAHVTQTQGAVSLNMGATINLAELPSVDAVAFASTGGWVVAASISPTIDTGRPAMLATRSIDGSSAPSNVMLGGPATALASLPGGGFAVGVDLGATTEIVLFGVSGGDFSQPVHVPVIGHLHVRAMVPEPTTCGSMASACRVFVGLEQQGGVEDVGNALVGLLEYDPSTPSMSRLFPSLIKTASPELTTLEYDAVDNGIVAASSTQNQITQIMLVQ